jgi:hypothetical protein
MATTTNYSWTTPDDTALVKDGAAAIRSLGSSIDTTTKNLNPSTTLGDIEYRSSTANTNTRLAIGSTGNVLTVAGGVPTWSAPPSSSPASANSFVATEESTTSDTYTALTTAQSVTLTTGTKVLVIIGCRAFNDTSTAGFRMGYQVSGATTVAMGNSGIIIMSRNNSVANVNYGYSRHSYLTVTAGSNTFTVNFSRSNGAGEAFFSDRYITVIDLGS